MAQTIPYLQKHKPPRARDYFDFLLRPRWPSESHAPNTSPSAGNFFRFSEPFESFQGTFRDGVIAATAARLIIDAACITIDDYYCRWRMIDGLI